MFLRGSQLGFCLLVFSLIAHATSLSNCVSSAIEIGKYEQPPVELARGVLAKARSLGFTFRGTHFPAGTIVDVSFGGNASPKNIPIEKRMPSALSGALVGSRTNWLGKEFLLVDMGHGRIRRIRADSIRTLGPSTARVVPTRSLVYDKALGAAGFIGKQLNFVAELPLVAAPQFPAVYYTVKFMNHALDVSPWLTVGGAVGVAGLALGTNVGRKVGARVSKTAFALNFTWWQPWKFSLWMDHLNGRERAFKMSDRLQAFDQSIPPHSPIDTDYTFGKDKARLLEDIGGIRLWALHSNKKPMTEEFLKKVRLAFADAIKVKKYLEKIGNPLPRNTFTVWTSEVPVKSHEGIGSVAYIDSGQMIITDFGRKAHKDLALFSEDREAGVMPLPYEKARKAFEDGATYGHEMVHLMMSPFTPNRWDSELITESLADYFSASAVGVTPHVGNEAFNENIPIREGVVRKYPLGKYPQSLNFNSYAQLGDHYHKNSQVLTRYFWRLRQRFGPSFDPVLLDTVFTDTPYNRGKGRHLRAGEELYAMTAALYAYAEFWKIRPEFKEAILTEAEAMGLAPEIILAIAREGAEAQN